MFETKLPSISSLWSTKTPINKIVTIVLMVLVLGALSTLGYLITHPTGGEGFTEFYVLNLERKADNYPRAIVLGQSAKVIVGIVNREHETIAYRMEITIDGRSIREIYPINLDHEKKWEQVVAFTPISAGLNQKAELLLYKGEVTEPYRTLFLWMDVKEAP